MPHELINIDPFIAHYHGLFAKKRVMLASAGDWEQATKYDNLARYFIRLCIMEKDPYVSRQR